MFLLMAAVQGATAAGAGGAGAASALARAGRKPKEYGTVTEGPLATAEEVDKLTTENFKLLGESHALMGEAGTFKTLLKDPGKQAYAGQLAQTRFSGAYDGSKVRSNRCAEQAKAVDKKLKTKKEITGLNPNRVDFVSKRNKVDTSIADAVTYTFNNKNTKAVSSVKTASKALGKTLTAKGVGEKETVDIVERAAWMRALADSCPRFSSAVDSKTIDKARNLDTKGFEAARDELKGQIEGAKTQAQSAGPQPSVN